MAMICAANDGEWNSVAVGAVVVILLLALGSAARQTSKAYGNFIDYWADDDRRRTKR
jgi:hypothetical protein